MSRKRSEVTIQDAIAYFLKQLETEECYCIMPIEPKEEVIKCEKCRQVAFLESHCDCGVCRNCIKLLIAYYEHQPCECTYKTISEEVTQINPDTGLEETITIEKEVVDIECKRCKKLKSLGNKLKEYAILEKAFIDESLWPLCQVDLRNGAITVPNEDKPQISSLDTVKAENLMQDEMITTVMLATAEVNEQLAATDDVTIISLEALAELNEQIIALQEEIKALKGGA